MSVDEQEMPGISVADMLAQIDGVDAQSVPDGDWLTTREWQARWASEGRAMCLAKVQRYIAKAQQAGLMERGKRPRQMVNGVVRQTDCYRWVGQREDQ